MLLYYKFTEKDFEVVSPRICSGRYSSGSCKRIDGTDQPGQVIIDVRSSIRRETRRPNGQEVSEGRTKEN